MNPAKRLEEMEHALERLREAASGAAVLVEGRRDLAALEALGVGGVHVRLNRGLSVEARLDQMVERSEMEGWGQLVVLMDWDRTGGRLQRRLVDGLAGRVRLNEDVRRLLAAACHCRCVEDIPSELAALRRQVAKR